MSLMFYWNIWEIWFECWDVFRDKGQNMGKWEKLSHVITVYGATSCAHPRGGPWL